MKKIVILLLSAIPLLAAGPFQATGFKVGEVTDSSAIVWTRSPLTAKPNPATATGLRPKESELGPTELTEIAQAANVTAANCPAAATDMSNSLDRSTKSGASMSPTLWVRNIAEPVSARNRAWLGVTGVTIGVN